jgi:hypothetical protein
MIAAGGVYIITGALILGAALVIYAVYVFFFKES